MTGADDYREFTRTRYRELVQLAKAHYSFARFGDVAGERPIVWWRHDVDFSVHAALRLAEIEAAESCRATYFFCLRSPFYNLLEPAVADRVKAIIALGHDVGVHFDAQAYGVSNEGGLDAPLTFERSVLSTAFDIEARSFSFHNPNTLTESWRDARYAGMVNCYSEYFRTAVGYVSDSNGLWRYRPLPDVLANHADRRLQVLTHPAWWQDRAMPPRARIERSVRGRADATLADYDRALERAGRPNIRD
jgi:hypothetical protein